MESTSGRLQASSECTHGYIAPERLNNPQLRVSKAMDVYSVGMIFHGIMRRVQPTRDVGENKKDIIQYCLQANTGPLSPKDPVEATIKQMMIKCTDHDPQQRPKVSEVRDELHSSLCKQDPVEIAQGVMDVLKTYT